jgi:hypothetical protein
MEFRTVQILGKISTNWRGPVGDPVVEIYFDDVMTKVRVATFESPHDHIDDKKRWMRKTTPVTQWQCDIVDY